MDPTTTLNLALFNFALGDRDEGLLYLHRLVDWLDAGGFGPYAGKVAGSQADFFVPLSTPEADPDA